jgi:hypothetical protein
VANDRLDPRFHADERAFVQIFESLHRTFSSGGQFEDWLVRFFVE